MTRWRCKLRDPDGTPKLDPVTGLDLYSEEERWFSFDNRRLYCLQRVACRHWPRRVVIETEEVPLELARMRELRKFDTRTFGLSVAVGRREDMHNDNSALSTWCWRSSVGIPEESQPEGGVPRQKSLRRRGSRPPRRDWGEGRRRGDEEYEEGWLSREAVWSVMLFLLLYLGLRLAVSIWRAHAQVAANTTGPGAPAP